MFLGKCRLVMEAIDGSENLLFWSVEQQEDGSYWVVGTFGSDTLWNLYSATDASECTMVPEGYGPIIPLAAEFFPQTFVAVSDLSTFANSGISPMLFSVPEAGTQQLTATGGSSDRPGPYPVTFSGGWSPTPVVLLDIPGDAASQGAPVTTTYVTPGLSAIQADGGCPGGNFTAVDFSGEDLSALHLAGVNLTDAVLDGANLSSADLSSAILHCASLRNVNLSGTTLCGADLSGCDLTGATAQDGPPVLSHPGTTSNPDDPANAVMRMRAATLPVAMLGMNWSGFDMAGAILASPGVPISLPWLVARDADLSAVQELAGANLTASDFSNATLRGTNLNNITAPWSSFAGAIFESDPESGFDLPARVAGAYLPSSNFSGARLNGVDFSWSHLYGKSTDPSPENAPSTNATLDSATLQGTIFSDANLGSMDFSGTMLEGTIFTSANLVNAAFPNVEVTTGPSPDNAVTSFIEASLQGADFSSATLVAASFAGAAIAEVGGQLTITRVGEGNKLETAVIDYAATKIDLSEATGCSCPDGSTGPCTAEQMVPAAPPAPPACVPSPGSWCPNPNASPASPPAISSSDDLLAAATRTRDGLLAALARRPAMGQPDSTPGSEPSPARGGPS